MTDLRQLTLSEACQVNLTRAGYASAAEAAERLEVEMDAKVYEVSFRYLGTAPVKRPETGSVDEGAQQILLDKLTRMDRAAPWTRYALTAIRDEPGRRAGDLAPGAGMDTATFKRNVRKLKALGLTHSLEVGYDLTPRGQQIVDLLDKA